MDFRRLQRQMLVPGIGPEGQARIGRAAVRIGGAGLSREVALRYAAGAGFARVDPAPGPASETDAQAPPRALLEGDTDVEIEIHADRFATFPLSLPAPRAVLGGALAALAALRRAAEPR